MKKRYLFGVNTFMKKTIAIVIIFSIIFSNLALAGSMEYTDEKLESAFLYLREHREDLNITGYSIDYANNGLKILALEWSEEEKESMKELLGIDNIDFKVDNSVYYPDISYAKSFIMRIGETVASTPRVDYDIKYPCKIENGILKLPVNTIFDVSGFQTDIDYHNRIFSVRLGSYDLAVDGKENTMKIGGYKMKLLVPPEFTEDECYIGYNDFTGIIDYDELNQIIIWSVEIGNVFPEEILRFVKEESECPIIAAYLETDRLLRDGVPIALDTDIYNKAGYLMLPVRGLFTAMDTGTEVIWYEDRNVVEVFSGNNKIEFRPFENKIFLNTEEISISGFMDVKDNRLFVPLRTLQAIESLSDYDVYWDDSSKAAFIRTGRPDPA